MMTLIQGVLDSITNNRYMKDQGMNTTNVHDRHISLTSSSGVYPVITISPIAQRRFDNNRPIKFLWIQIDIWGQNGYNQIFKLYENDDASIISMYGTIQGIHAIFDKQNLTFNGISAYFLEQNLQTNKSNLEITKTNIYQVSIIYKALVKSPAEYSIIINP